MIGKVITGKGFSGCIGYCLEDKKMKEDPDLTIIENRAEILLFNKCFGNRKELVQQFHEVRKLNPKQSKPVFHLVLSMAPGEHVPGPQLIQIAQDCAKEFGFADNQFIAVEHKDTQHQHIHIVANRIGYSGKTNVSDSNSYKRMAEFCRKMEKKFSLQPVLSPRRFLPREQQLLPRNDQRKNHIKAQLLQILRSSTTMNCFLDKVEAQGFHIIKGRGISFIDSNGVKIKGSDMGLSLSAIEKILNVKQGYQNEPDEPKAGRPIRRHSPLVPGTAIVEESDISKTATQIAEAAADLVADLFKAPSQADHTQAEAMQQYYRYNQKKKKKKRGFGI